ncbi:MAG: ribonuclease HI family protein [Omnitrophica WOR_2 bacterium]
MITLQFDGLYKGVPGVSSGSRAGFMGYGWVISRRGAILARGHGLFGDGRQATSNTAEYLGLIEGLEALWDMGVKEERIEVIGDAKSVIEQMRGVSAVSSPLVKTLYRRAKRLADQFERVHWTWTPRKNNREADELSRHAFRQVCANKSEYESAVQAIKPKKNHRRESFLLLSGLRIYQSR